MAADPPSKGGGPIKMVHPQTFTEPQKFLNALGEFPADRACDSVETLFSQWNSEMKKVASPIAPKHSFQFSNTCNSGLHKNQWVMKQAG